MKIFKNESAAGIEITIPVEFDENGNPTRYKIHLLKPSELIEFNDDTENTNEIVCECLNNNLNQK